MIIVPQDDQLRIVTQGDHAHFAAELLSLFRLPELVGHPRRQELLAAVREHDNGWRESDAAPSCATASGEPYDFRSSPLAKRCEVWRRGAQRYRASRPYLALLATHHARRLFASQAGDPLVEPCLADWREVEEELLRECALDAATLAADYAWLALADTLSLMVCTADAETELPAPWRAQLRRDTLLLDPFPLAGSSRLELSCRYIPSRPYTGDIDLAMALATSPWSHFSVRIAPFPEL